MTISSTTRTAGPFIGNGTASSFPFVFKVFQGSDLLIVSTLIATGVETTLVLNTDYTVALNVNQDSNPGGTVTLTAGPLATGYRLLITSDIAALQQTDISNGGGFYPEVITDALDKLTILIQQLQQQQNDLALLSYVPCTGAVPGTSYTAPAPIRILFYNGAALPYGQAAPVLSYTSADGLTATLNFTTESGTPDDRIDALCAITS